MDAKGKGPLKQHRKTPNTDTQVQVKHICTAISENFMDGWAGNRLFWNLSLSQDKKEKWREADTLSDETIALAWISEERIHCTTKVCIQHNATNVQNELQRTI